MYIILTEIGKIFPRMEHCDLNVTVRTSQEWLTDTLAFYWPDSDETKPELWKSRHKSSAKVYACVCFCTVVLTVHVHAEQLELIT